MEIWKDFADSLKQGVRPEMNYPRQSQYLLVTESYSGIEIKECEHLRKGLSILESTWAKCLHARNYPKVNVYYASLSAHTR